MRRLSTKEQWFLGVFRITLAAPPSLNNACGH
jgi:hypothetical protein